MKQLIKSKAAFLLATCTFILLLSSGFISRPGGEGFEVYINHKLVLQQFGKDINTTKSISLANAKPDEEVLVKYHRCGNGSNNRVFTIRDGQDKILKQWAYKNTTEKISLMTCKVKDITSLQQGSNNTFKLYYSSSEIPNGRLLASLVLASAETAHK